MTYSSFKKINISLEANTSNLVTRDQGIKLLSAIIVIVNEYDNVIIDLSDVMSLSPSFVDELFNGLRKALGEKFTKKIKIVCNVPEWRKLIQTALKYRS
jgi:alkyl hydroperoxide reductase subunit AhpF